MRARRLRRLFLCVSKFLLNSRLCFASILDLSFSMTDISAGVACQTAGVLKADVALAIADTFLAVAFTCNGPTLNYVWGKKNKQCQTQWFQRHRLWSLCQHAPHFASRVSLQPGCLGERKHKGSRQNRLPRVTDGCTPHREY